MKTHSCYAILFLLLTMQVSSKNKDDIVGRWMSSDNNLIVDVYPVPGEYQAKVVWFDDTDDPSQPMNTRLDTKNPDRQMRGRKIIGLTVLWGLHYNTADIEWQGGTIYDSSTGKKWDAKAWINEEGVLKVRGYWNFPFLGQTIAFKRKK